MSRARLEAEDPSNGLHEAVTWAERQGKLVFSDDAKDDDHPTHSVAFLHELPEDANNDLVSSARYLSGREGGRGRGGARDKMGRDKMAEGLSLTRACVCVWCVVQSSCRVWSACVGERELVVRCSHGFAHRFFNAQHLVNNIRDTRQLCVFVWARYVWAVAGCGARGGRE